MRFEHILVVASVIFMPLQSFGVLLMGSRYDITPFLILILCVLKITYQKIRLKTIIFLISLILLQLILCEFFNISPGYRVVSGIVWLGGLIYLLFEGDKIKYDSVLVFHLIVSGLLISACLILYEYFLLDVDRPSAFFWEPSFAGLCLYSAALGILSILVENWKGAGLKIRLIFLFIIFFIAAMLTWSMHIFTFLFSAATISFFVLLPSTFKKNPGHFAIIMTVLLIAIFVIIAGVTKFEHFNARLDFDRPTNFSLLAWLRGGDQMFSAILISPILGVGLGSTGYFEFSSQYSDILSEMGKPDLNLTDSYSLAFRLIIEIGLPLTLIFLCYIFLRIGKFNYFINKSQSLPLKLRSSYIFIFVFSFTVIVGCLLKEPLYPQSFLYLSIMLFASLPLNIKRLP